MKLLIIGGTGFLGRHLTSLALDWGHEVTLFNRGHRQHPGWRDLVQLTGDRDKDLRALHGEGPGLDLAIDTCCYRPEQAASLSAALLGRCERLIFISTISVYRDFAQRGMDESSPLHETGAGETPTDYGPLKVLCEAEYRARWGERLCILRPGVLCGPYDPTGRLAWWVKRIQQGGPWLLPGEGQDRLQYLDVRDCAEFVLRAAEQQLGGIFNLLKPGIALADWVDRIAARLAPAMAPQPEWVPWSVLLAAGVEPWQSYPTLLPNEQPEYAGYGRISAEAAIVQGLNFRPLEETVADLAQWLAKNDQALVAGMTAEQERALQQVLRVGSLQ
ncbi:NAD-dependent epimerase/dehydratase family protein [Aeromonas sp. MR7]|uniref:NAD-dependent epimerase/dehydratase family protein n=1 Tax=Aeromonas sp. MR7 TaxID=2923419 RepID=UPI001F4B8A41|nr:NAD-dependent epimerase/dehydratase family protein [Aeromonas sp. MR7]MCH7347315.1 NAD-dependent epimerase/dehydratase family protein [Aeromonas sp. MR7]